MQDLNSVALLGRVANDPELQNINSGASKLDVSIAFNTTRKNGDKWEDEGNFLNVTLWGKTAETVSRFVSKGKQVAITGHLKQERWEKDGKQYSALKLVADNFQLIGSSSGQKKSEPPAEAQQFANAVGGSISEDIPW